MNKAGSFNSDNMAAQDAPGAILSYDFDKPVCSIGHNGPCQVGIVKFTSFYRVALVSGLFLGQANAGYLSTSTPFASSNAT